VFILVAESSQSLAGELCGLLSDMRAIVSGRRVTMCPGRGGWSPALFVYILAARSGLLS